MSFKKAKWCNLNFCKAEDTLLYALSAYERFLRKALISDSGGNLHTTFLFSSDGQSGPFHFWLL